MNILVVADVLNELYNNGIVRSSTKLDERDFLQMAKAAKGSVIRQYYFEERNNSDNVYFFVAANTKPLEFKVKKDHRERLVVDIDYSETRITRLPDGNGILRVTGIPEKGKIDYANNFTKGIAGSEYLYCTPAFLEDTGEQIYMASSDQVRLYTGTPPEMVEMLAVFDNDESDIPDDVVWQIFSYVFTFILKIIGVPVDPNDDSSPVIQTIKSKLGTPQPL